jgi:glycosidase
MEFHISRSIREKLDLDELLFSYTGNVVFANVAASRRLAQALTALRAAGAPAETQTEPVNAGAMYAMGLIDELSHALIARYRKDVDPAVLTDALQYFEEQGGAEGKEKVERLLLAFSEQFPNVAVYRGKLTAREWLAGTTDGLPNRESALEELLLLWLANTNRAFQPFQELFADKSLKQATIYQGVTSGLAEYFGTRPPVSAQFSTLLEALRAPMLASPGSLTGQLEYIRENWVEYLGGEAAEELKRIMRQILLAGDLVREENVAIWMRFHPPGPNRYDHGEPGRHTHGFIGDEYMGFDQDFLIGPDGIRRPRYADNYQAPLNEYEAFSQDQAWMPNVVLMAKSTYVWLEQLSKKYQRHIHRLDHIPEEELRLLADRGMTGLWLIGLWERSIASKTIKNLRGQADAVASAYSLKEYCIAEDLGGKSAYETLRDRAARYGIRLASDMVPNHMGIDSTWVIEHPDWFISRPESPFPVYQFEGPDLSPDSRVEIKIEDHYFDQTDAAVVFRLRHHRDGSTRYVYHGNDGTTFAWNDTAQLDYSKEYVREEVIQTILQVARLFPIIRFDAAMTLAKRHVQRLWFPLPGVGGSIPSRAESAMSDEEFDALMPNEFWREVVDRVAAEVPGTLLLAEAFWLLEGYFVRTLGMHRVYNSAFMNMLRDEENAKYRSYLKKTIEFDPDILKRYVNFMSNPDERTAIDQFGDGDKFFGTCTLLATLPGLPMFGHGQVEGFTERYGMEFKQAKMDETPNEGLVARHQREIAPLLKRRWLFAESTHFVLYDFWSEHGTVDENVFAYSNRNGGERAIVLYNNVYQSTRGTIHVSAASMDKGSGTLQQRTLSEGLDLTTDPSITIAFRDPVRELEFLRRASDIQHSGLTMELRGYGYMVLQNWRELRSSAEYPWDRLCDSLNGAGVRNLEEAVSRLRLQPLHDALRHALSSHNLEAFATVAGELAASAAPAAPAEAVREVSEEKAALEGALGQAAAQQTEVPAAAGPTEESPLGKPLDPRLRGFFEQRARFFERASEVFGEDVPAGGTEGFAGVLRLPNLGAPELATWPAAAGEILPLSLAADRMRDVWGPVLAFLLVRDLSLTEDGEAQETVTLFDRLHLRAALADTFLSLGMQGEEPWRCAARVRLLLSGGAGEGAASLTTKSFWSDPEVRWLGGVSEAFGKTYVNQERFEALAGWLELPNLIAAAAEEDRAEGAALVGRSTAAVAEAGAGIAKAGYNLQVFLGVPEPDALEPDTPAADDGGAGAIQSEAGQAGQESPIGRESPGGRVQDAPAMLEEVGPAAPFEETLESSKV